MSRASAFHDWQCFLTKQGNLLWEAKTFYTAKSEPISSIKYWWPYLSVVFTLGPKLEFWDPYGGVVPTGPSPDWKWPSLDVKPPNRHADGVDALHAGGPRNLKKHLSKYFLRISQWYLSVTIRRQENRVWCSQLSNLWWIQNSVSIGFGTAMKTG